MRSGLKRVLVAFLAAMFLSNNVAAAARACIQEIAGIAPRIAAEGHGEGPSQHLSRRALEENPCIGRCVENAKSHPQDAAVDSPAFEFTPARVFTRAAAFLDQGTPRIAAQPPLAGPRLNILFRNLRN